MKKQVLFIHGGGDEWEKVYKSDSKLADSLQDALGNDYEVVYPKMKEEKRADFGWPRQISEEVNKIKDNVILVGHSLGASMILKYLSEMEVPKKINGVFLLGTPHWGGNEDWKQGLKLEKDFADKLPKEIPLFLYQCLDDETVPVEHYQWYVHKLPWATAHEIENGGYQFNNDLHFMTKDIKKLSL